jgi:hypothetical protein
LVEVITGWSPSARRRPRISPMSPTGVEVACALTWVTSRGSIAAILTVHHGIIPPTINLDDPDDELDLDVAAHKARHMDVPAALNNSFGFGGHNAVLVFARA